MPTLLKDDKLLFATRLVLTIMLWLTVIAGIAATVMIPVVFVRHDFMVRGLAENRIDPSAIPWIAVMLALGAVLAALGFFFFRHLRRIVESVSDGDPFIPVNADRLYFMGWLSLAIQLVLIFLSPLTHWFDALPDKANVHRDSTGVSYASLITALLLFVLARVFRVGSQMREELEGTV